MQTRVRPSRLCLCFDSIMVYLTDSAHLPMAMSESSPSSVISLNKGMITRGNRMTIITMKATAKIEPSLLNFDPIVATIVVLRNRNHADTIRNLSSSRMSSFGPGAGGISALAQLNPTQTNAQLMAKL